MKKIVYIALVAAMFAGCSEETEIALQTGGEVRLTAGIASRATLDNTWDSGDEVALYSVCARVVNLNIKYRVNPLTGLLTAASNLKLDMLDGEVLNIYAYSPYGLQHGDLNLAQVDVTDQSSDAKVQAADLLWAKAENQSNRNVTLQFEHQLARLNFTLTAGLGEISDLTDLEATLEGANAMADFGVLTGDFSNVTKADITLNVVHTGMGTATITALVVPTADIRGNCCLVLKANNGKIFRWRPLKKNDWLGGNRYAYHITVGETLK